MAPLVALSVFAILITKRLVSDLDHLLDRRHWRLNLFIAGQLPRVLDVVHDDEHQHDDGVVAEHHLPLHLRLQRQPSQQSFPG